MVGAFASSGFDMKEVAEMASAKRVLESTNALSVDERLAPV